MVRGNFPVGCPQVAADVFFALNPVYLWINGANADLRTIEGRSKTVDDQVVSSSALALDATLTASLQPGRKYRIQGKLFFSSNFKLRFVGPSSPARVHMSYERIDTAGDARVLATAYSAADIVCSFAGVLSFDGIIHNGVTAGEFGVSWAQNASIVTPTVLYAGSWLQHSLVD